MKLSKKTSLLYVLVLLTIAPAAMPAQAVNPKQKQMKKEGIGVVLSGGSARGFAHLGALQALEDHGIVPTFVSGTSMGAVLGSIYASGVHPYRIYDFAREQNFLRIYRPSLHGALFRTTFITHMLDQLMPQCNSFDDLQKKMFVCATDLNTGNYRIFDSGPLKQVVVASASIPFFFEPTVIDSITYVDGGLVNNLPVEPLMERCRYVIGISVNHVDTVSQGELNGMKAVQRVLTIVVVNTERERSEHCQFFINIKEANRYSLLDFDRVEDFYNIGYAATLDYIKQNPAILRLAKLKE